MAKKQHDTQGTPSQQAAAASKPEAPQPPGQHEQTLPEVEHDKSLAGGRQAHQLAGHAEGLFVDTAELARQGRAFEDHTPIMQFARLVGDLPTQLPGSEVQWSVAGKTDMQGRQWVHVVANAQPVIECQRCMQPFALQVDVDNLLQVMKSEAELEAQEAHDESTGEVVERIVGTRRLDVLGLVEDEIILGLPYVPKHEICPSLPAPLHEADDDDTPSSPFAALGKLKNH
ncbi:DUF177 domain-containing protein [Pusillimonas sp. ANT_WB101]|uniref:YceD family protein n=1 Tax=Pusillimonas sp. ANT_WB101 TaxID=2597356 RepID=UPI0011EFC327|nr:DUF177 domain-containing protein [Pusillimonas sp. ANT_WB101]KAA0888590.1 hypothetical protein FQ179_21780 [Pusillimonas sp. ANT_WB101]